MVGEDHRVRDDSDARVLRVQPGGHLAVGDDEDAERPGRKLLQRPQREAQLVVVVEAVERDRAWHGLPAQAGHRLLQLKPEQRVGPVHPGVHGVNGQTVVAGVSGQPAAAQVVSAGDGRAPRSHRLSRRPEDRILSKRPLSSLDNLAVMY